MQTAQEILLVRPASFTFNEETAVTNKFQKRDFQNAPTLAKDAVAEFEQFAPKLSESGVVVTIVDDTAEPAKPDAVFPNNWISFHGDGTVVLYPMYAPARRQERRQDIIDQLRNKYLIKNVVDLSGYEAESRFLEGTGSMVLDRKNEIAYACLSPRTDLVVFNAAYNILGYKAFAFDAQDEAGVAIYHTNVMMNIGDAFAVVCLSSIVHAGQRVSLVDQLMQTGHEVIDISIGQMKQFAGNMLSLRTIDNDTVLAMSQSAFDSLDRSQRSRLSQYCHLLPLSVHAIESAGGGSVRCMIAEIFLSRIGS